MLNTAFHPTSLMSGLQTMALSSLPHDVNKMAVFANLNTHEEQFKSYG
jgi:hypothetical protein